MLDRIAFSDPLDALCPMHFRTDPAGVITNVGPTLFKLEGGAGIEGRHALDVIEIVRPAGVKSLDDVRDRAGDPIHVRLKAGAGDVLRGLAVPDGEGLIFDLSFGIGIVDAVGRHNLTAHDFAPTNLTTEMLYLVEAKTAVMEESQNLIHRLHGAMIAAEEKAFTDQLTGLKNRRALDHILDRLIEGQTVFACMHLDLDLFKAVNDTYGHAAGDHVLTTAASIMKAETRDRDTVARIGGDEFVILLHELSDPKRIDAIARRIIAAIEVPMPWGEVECRVSSSAGTSISLRYEEPSAEEMLHHADLALYASKRAGRAQHTLFRMSMIEEIGNTGGTP
ncbi:MAG: GGDEF domain-containing protein [Shimia sp.]